MPVLLLICVDAILVACRCIQRNFLMFFYEQMFFEIFVAKGDTGQFFLEIIA